MHDSVASSTRAESRARHEHGQLSLRRMLVCSKGFLGVSPCPSSSRERSCCAIGDVVVGGDFGSSCGGGGGSGGGGGGGIDGGSDPRSNILGVGRVSRTSFVVIPSASLSVGLAR